MVLPPFAGVFVDTIASMAKFANNERGLVLGNPTMDGGVGAWRPEQHIATADLETGVNVKAILQGSLKRCPLAHLSEVRSTMVQLLPESSSTSCRSLPHGVYFSEGISLIQSQTPEVHHERFQGSRFPSSAPQSQLEKKIPSRPVSTCSIDLLRDLLNVTSPAFPRKRSWSFSSS